MHYLWLLLVMLSVTAHASDGLGGDGELDVFSLSLEELMVVEVSGSTFSMETLGSTPASVTVFSESEIKQLGLRYVHELANLVPGFESKRQSNAPHTYSVSARGRQIGTGTRSVKIIINDQAVTSAYIGSSSASLALIPLENVSSIEFIRGPGSAVYGSGALLGVINIKTQQNKSYVQQSLGNDSYTGTDINYANNGYHLSAIMRSHQGQSYSLKDADTAARIEAQDPLAEQHVYLSKSTGDTQFSIHHHRSVESGFYSIDRIDNTLHYRSLQYSSFHVNHTLQAVHGFDVGVSAFMNYRKGNFNARLTGNNILSAVSSPSSTEALKASAQTESKLYGVKLVANELYETSQLTFGGEYQFAEPVASNVDANFNIQQLSQGNFPVDYYDNNPPDIPFIQAKENQMLALFAEYQRQISMDLNAVVSLRYDYSKNINEGELLPRLALVYRLSPVHYLKAMHSTAFRNPDSLELGSINNPSLNGDVNLTSEKITSNEVIWLAQYANIYLNVAYFENHIQDAIEQANVNGIRQFKNLDSESNDGMEFEYRHQLNEKLSVRFSYLHMLSMLDSAFRVSDESGSLTFSWSDRRWQGNLMSNYQSATQMLTNPALDRITLPNFWVHNMSINYQHDNHLKSQLLINNLLDKHYTTPTISSILDEGIPGRGREVIYSVSVPF